MSFQGLASTLVVLVVIGVILGMLLYAEFERMRGPEIPTSEDPTAAPSGSPWVPGEGDAAGASGPWVSQEELEQWKKRLEQVELDLEKDRQQFERDRADFEAWRREVEADLRIQGDRVRRASEAASRLRNWAILALCGAGAVTVGNMVVAVARLRTGQQESEGATTTQQPGMRRAYLRPKKLSGAGRDRQGRGKERQSETREGADRPSFLWSQLMSQRQHMRQGGVGQSPTA
jgi:hypothetical protein